MPRRVTDNAAPRLQIEIARDGWELHAAGEWLVIPTNLFVKNNRANVMGAGIAKQARRRFADLEAAYGARLLRKVRPSRAPGEPVESGDIEAAGRIVVAFGGHKLVCAPVKFNWWMSADLALIERSLTELVDLAAAYPDMRLALPRLGCGNGGRDWDSEVRPLVERIIGAAAAQVRERFTLLTPPVVEPR